MALSPALLLGWASNLWKWYAKNSKTKSDELQAISNIVGGVSLKRLAEFYVEPSFQYENPADCDDENPMQGINSELRSLLNQFLGGEFKDRDGRQFLFVLADAGMGKSSLLAILKLTHLAKFWPGGVDFRLLKLGKDTLDAIKVIEKPMNTVLLLDSLDEDPVAQGRIHERLQEVLQASKNFRQIVITCRTQFFPKGEAAPIEKLGRIKVEGFSCNLIYLAPFSDEQVDIYLRNLFPNTWFESLVERFRGQANPNFTKAKETILLMRSLRMRPMLLASIEDLMDSDVEVWNEYTVFEALVQKWFDREKQKDPTLDLKVLQEACELLAVYLQGRTERQISAEDLSAFANERPALASLKPLGLEARALLNKTSQGAYRFAHYSVQEFFVIKALKEGLVTEKPFKTTEMLERFGALADVRVQVDTVLSDVGYLFQADLSGARLSEANLIGAYLVNANLRGADLSCAGIIFANFRGADLSDANLYGTNFQDANLKGANLKGANLQGAKLTDTKNLTQNQLNSAKGNYTTILPEGLKPPDHWPKGDF